MVIQSTIDNAYDTETGLTLALPDRKFVSSYIEALHEGMQPCRHKVAQEEIDNLQNGNAETWKLFAETCPNSVDTDNFCMEDMFWLTKDDIFLGYIMLRPETAEGRRKYGGNTGRELRPSVRSKGYGSNAMGLLTAIAAKRGYSFLEMVTAEDNIAARKPWEKAGAILIEKSTTLLKAIITAQLSNIEFHLKVPIDA